MQKSFLRQIISNKCEKRLEVRFPLSDFVKISDFPRLGQTPPRQSLIDFLVGKQSSCCCCCFDAWEWFELILVSQSVKNRCLYHFRTFGLVDPDISPSYPWQFWSIFGREDWSILMPDTTCLGPPQRPQNVIFLSGKNLFDFEVFWILRGRGVFPKSFLRKIPSVYHH